jgi:hypothetical protein
MAERQGRNVMVSTFRVPDEYERARLEAERRAALAQMLEAQAYQPLDVRQPAPIAPSQGLAKILKSYVGAYQRRKAEEAEEKAKGKEEETAEQIMGRLMGRELPEFEPDEAKRAEQEAARAKEIADVRADIEPSIARQRETGQLEEVMPTAQYTRDPMEALRLAGTPAGQGALQRNQVLAGLLARSVEQPAQEEFYAPVVGEGGKYVQFGKRGGTRASDIAAPAPAPAAVTTATIMKDGKPTVIDARTGTVIGEGVPQRTPTEPLVSIMGPDGKPVFVKRSEAEGQTPFAAPPRMTANVVTDIAQGKRAIDEFGDATIRTQKFIDDINDGKLDLYKGAGMIYSGKRAFGGDKTFEEGQEPDYVRYFALQRFVTEQVNRILNLAKGPQTDQDALRARQQILDNLDNEQIVVSGLRDLKNIWERESRLNKTYINALRTEFGQEPEFVDEDEDIIDLPPR